MEPPEPLKDAVRRLFGSVGLEVIRSGGSRWISNHRIKTVLDIGANTGQFASDIRRILPDAWIYSFEPVPQAFGMLQRRFRDDAKFHAQQLALGDAPGSVQINVSEFSPSSSLLGMSELHTNEFPFTAGHSSTQATIQTLDALSDELHVLPEVLIKIDVQGYENKVIAGGRGLIARAAVVIVEVNLELLYEGQPSFDDIYVELRDLGFDFHGSWHQLHSRRSGRVLSSDVIFLKRD